MEKRFQFKEFSENLFKLRQRVSRKVKTKKKKEKNAARKERKATKTLAIVLGKYATEGRVQIAQMGKGVDILGII